MSAHSALKEIFFGFDHYDLSADARATLKTTDKWLKNSRPPSRELRSLRWTGHQREQPGIGCRTRGLSRKVGVADARLSIASYGEEIPVCREHSESCWSKNRRDRFVALNVKPSGWILTAWFQAEKLP
jgi:peptidoglycan-associated lipoprotein